MKENFKIKSKYDGLILDGLIISNEHPQAIVQLSHGMCEHKERYLDFINELTKQGYLCLIHDHRGHGKSIKNKDDLGYFYKNGDLAIVEDLHQISLMIKERYPDLPVYLLGHSMGSLVVRCYVQKYDHDIDGLIVCGSPSDNPLAFIGIHLSRLYAKVKGDHIRPQLLQKLSFSSFNKRFNTNIANSWICSNAKVVEEYNQNPLCTFTFTANGFETLFKLVKKTYHNNNWVMNQPTLPILFIAGKQDPCITNEKKFNKAVQCMKKHGYMNIENYLFENMRHEILNETENEQVYQYIFKTLQQWQNNDL